METRQLRYFLAIAEAESVTGAAATLNISQPALTSVIRNLEEELDTRLFERLPRGVCLTETGEALFRHARTVLTQLNDAHSEIRNLKQAVQHEVAIGAGPMWLRMILPEIVGGFSRAHPEYEVVVRGGYEQALFELLRSGAVEFVITEIGHTASERAFVTQALSTDRYEIICREDHPLVSRQPLSLQDLQGYRWAMPDKAQYARRRLNGLFFAENLPAPEVSLRSSSLPFITSVLLASDLLSFVVCTPEDMRLGPGLATLCTAFELPSRKAGIVQRAGGWLSHGASLLKDALVGHFEETNDNE